MKDVSKTMSAIWPLLYTGVVTFNDRNIQLISMHSLLGSKTERVELRVGATATTEYYTQVISQKALKVIIYKKAAIITVKVAGYLKLCSN